MSPRSSPFGAWTPTELRALPRFPHPESFPTAKGLINRVLLEDGLTYRDLRIALFWLGFALLEVPTQDEPNVSLVPLCKDLDTYVDTAVEFGYNPMSSVHARPVCVDSADALQPSVAGTVGTVALPSSSSSYSSSSSSTPPLVASNSTPASLQGRLGCNAGTSADPPVARLGSDEEPPNIVGNGLLGCQDIVRDSSPLTRCRPLVGGTTAASSRMPLACDSAQGNIEDSLVQNFAYKVKLLHAGGWSSSSGSEGNSTPPTPPASSSTSVAARQGRGLDAVHVDQFTVSFVSDLQLHEDLEETCCLCAFCLDDMNMGDELCRLPCMHTFHRRCVHAWLARDRRCMLCRLDVTRPCGWAAPSQDGL